MLDFLSSYFLLGVLCVGLFIIFCGSTYLLLRPLVLWYFKIYTIVSELQENNAILREIRDELRERNYKTPSRQQPKEDYDKYMPR